jgi:hypothetical protein
MIIARAAEAAATAAPLQHRTRPGGPGFAISLGRLLPSPRPLPKVKMTRTGAPSALGIKNKKSGRQSLPFPGSLFPGRGPFNLPANGNSSARLPRSCTSLCGRRRPLSPSASSPCAAFLDRGPGQIIIPDARYRDDLQCLFGSLFRASSGGYCTASTSPSPQASRHFWQASVCPCLDCASSGLSAGRQLPLEKSPIAPKLQRLNVAQKPPSTFYGHDVATPDM